MSKSKARPSDLNILNVIVTVPDTPHGGAERAGLSFGDSLAVYENVDNVFMGGIDSNLANDLNLTQQVHAIPAHTNIRNQAERILSSANNIWNATISTRLSPPNPLESYDLVHIHNAVPIVGMAIAAIQSKVAGVPYFVTTHGINKIPEIPDELGLTRTQRILFNNVFLRLYKYILKNAEHLFALSTIDQEQLINWFPDQSVSILHNGVRVQSENYLEGGSDYIDPDKPTLLFVGRIMESKGISDLLDTYELLETECQLLIVGPERDGNLTQRIHRMDGNVEYTGYIEDSELNYLYHNADLFVFPTRSDVFPLVTLEAMAAGTGVITTEVGGLPEQIPDAAGEIVPPNSPVEFAKAIEDALSSEEIIEEMGRVGQKVVQERYTWEAIAEEAIQTYKDHI